MAQAHPRRPPPYSLATLLAMGLGSLATLGGLVWLALAYNHSALLAVLLPILPVLFSFFVEQCKSTLEELRENDPPAEGGPPVKGDSP